MNLILLSQVLITLTLSVGGQNLQSRHRGGALRSERVVSRARCLVHGCLRGRSSIHGRELGRQGCQMAKFDPFLSLDCARVEGMGAQSKDRKGSNFAAQRSGAIVQKPKGPYTYDLKIQIQPSGNYEPLAEEEHAVGQLDRSLVQHVPHPVDLHCSNFQHNSHV